MKIPRVVLAGASSGAGKTSVACAIIHSLRMRGLSVQPFKVGPDYIDPSYLESVSGNPVHNLDVWLMGAGGVAAEFCLRSRSDVSVIEGVMGYYDGFSGRSNYSSTHHVASITRSPTILVLDASKAARSVAATALGFARFHRDSRIAGVILNMVGSRRHESLCREALEEAVGIPVVGAIPRDPGLALESRHLGLLPAGEDKRLGAKILRMAGAIADHINVDQVLRIAGAARRQTKPGRVQPAPAGRKKPKCVIAVALDGSFNFYYRTNLDCLRTGGAEIRFFSPISDDRLPECDGIYIGGGFPEVRAGPLARNSKMKGAIRKAAERGMPLYAECGGLMYLTRSIRDGGGRRHRMVGIFDADTQMAGRATLNYTKARVACDCVVASAGTRFHGHEFHYSELADVAGDARFAYDLEIGHGIQGKKDGLVQHSALASYGHVFFGGSGFAKTFVDNCTSFARR